MFGNDLFNFGEWVSLASYRSASTKRGGNNRRQLELVRANARRAHEKHPPPRQFALRSSPSRSNSTERETGWLYPRADAEETGAF